MGTAPDLPIAELGMRLLLEQATATAIRVGLSRFVETAYALCAQATD